MPDADGPAGDGQLFRAAERCESAFEALDVDTRDEKVGVLCVDAAQRIPDGAADDVGVEPEGADVLLDRP